MYSLSLVIWEILSRVKDDKNFAPQYFLPYAKELGSDPTIEAMKIKVINQGFRPQNKSLLGQLTSVIKSKS